MLTDLCSFPATTRQIEYDMRICWAKAGYHIRDGPLFLHKTWYKQLKSMFPNKIGSWKPWDLLEQACGLEVKNPHRSIRRGCPLWNGTYYCLNEIHIVDKGAINVEYMRKLFKNNRPVVAVIEIRGDYPRYTESPYLGVNENGQLEELMYHPDGKRVTHAVVLVGECEVEEVNIYGIDKGIYWIYQNALVEGQGVGTSSFLPNGMSILHPRVVIEAYLGISYPPNVLALPEHAKKILDFQVRKEHKYKNDSNALKNYQNLEEELRSTKVQLEESDKKLRHEQMLNHALKRNHERQVEALNTEIARLKRKAGES